MENYMKDITMNIRCFLTVKSSGAVRVTKNKPALDYDEITIGLQLELPRALFEKPQLAATLIVPAGAALPSELPVEVVGNIRDAVESASGMEVRLSMALDDRLRG
jgi:hypothetical protein